jgi:hypothetical protein
MRSIHAIVFLSCVSFSAVAFSWAPATIERQPDGITLQLATGEPRIQVVSAAVVRVAFSKSYSFFEGTSIGRVAFCSAATAFASRLINSRAWNMRAHPFNSSCDEPRP